ncbi:MAG: 50S ribosomal protein L22 [Nanoarchaeota archaeon]|nr:50S ribosomal protein L22 [Nanoarchaeota archaeon]MBU4452348.1 50S ribosomal protein L22 [Nanoarchaeota archaeon]MCG2723375.1 50S ribosomal protein L22 [archaeon]
MSNINYPIETSAAKTSRAGFSNRRLSWKDSVEVARFIKGMKVTSAKAFLQDVIKKKRAVPLKKFNDNRGHKHGMGPGRYPVNVSLAFLELINSAEKNAENKGLDTKGMIIQYAFANKGATFMRSRRNEFRGQERKSANVSIILHETGASKSKAAKKQEKKAEARTEKPKEHAPKVPKEAKKEETKTEHAHAKTKKAAEHAHEKTEKEESKK